MSEGERSEQIARIGIDLNRLARVAGLGGFDLDEPTSRLPTDPIVRFRTKDITIRFPLRNVSELQVPLHRV